MHTFRFTFFLAFGLTLSFQSFSQSDTACVKTRWISVKNTVNNAILFDTTTSILRTIRDVAHENQIELYHEENTSFSYGQWYPIPLVKNNASDYISYIDDRYTNVFTIRIQSDIPYVDEWGDPLIREDEYGVQYFVYPDPEIHIINLLDIEEIRIREERNYNELDRVFEGEFRATGISFYVKNSYETRELFWISLDELNEDLENPIEYPWHSFIENREYVGFQYMQVSCYDDLIRY